MAHSIDVVTLRDERIAGITAFHDAAALGGFGLPPDIPPGLD